VVKAAREAAGRVQVVVAVVGKVVADKVAAIDLVLVLAATVFVRVAGTKSRI